MRFKRKFMLNRLEHYWCFSQNIMKNHVRIWIFLLEVLHKHSISSHPKRHRFIFILNIRLNSFVSARFGSVCLHARKKKPTNNNLNSKRWEKHRFYTNCVEIFKWIWFFVRYNSIIFSLNCFKGFFLCRRFFLCLVRFHFFNLILDVVYKSTNFHHNRTDSKKWTNVFSQKIISFSL